MPLLLVTVCVRVRLPGITEPMLRELRPISASTLAVTKKINMASAHAYVPLLPLSHRRSLPLFCSLIVSVRPGIDRALLRPPVG